MYKCAIIGVSGGRAAGLAAAYAHVQKGRLAAVSTRIPAWQRESGHLVAQAICHLVRNPDYL